MSLSASDGVLSYAPDANYEVWPFTPIKRSSAAIEEGEAAEGKKRKTNE